MSANKAALKAAKTALDNENWDEAVTQAQIVLTSDSQNYFAKLFLGRALEKQNKVDDAAKAYTSATKIKPDDAQGWLGLCSLYESQGSGRIDEYGDVAVQLALLFAKADDLHRAQTTIEKLVSFAKANGTTAQFKRALQVQLPTSPIYEYLEGRVPSPSHTFMRLAELTETEEKQRINKEIGERRTRLGARIGQVTTQVKNEVYSRSDLESLYKGVIDWSQDDELRREFEEKLLQRAYDTLTVMPDEYKDGKRQQVVEISRGMVIIKHPSRLAWDIHLEWQDLSNIQDLDVNILYEYVGFFSDSGLSKVLRAFLKSEISPFPQPEKVKPADGEEEEDEETLSPEDRLILMGEGLGDGKGSALAHRLVGEYYLHLEEFESAIETARNGLRLLMSESQKAGLELQENKDALTAILATSLVHHQSPRNHPEARTLFDDMLQRKPKFTSALIGLGLILEEQEEYTDAEKLLSQALEQDPGNVRIGAEAAWCNALSGKYSEALATLEKYLPDMKSESPKSRDLRAQTLYRIGICLWQLDDSKAARKDRNGAYARFLSAIKTNVNFAPAYTSLGLYYSDYPKDKKRARQCFQKAFELSSSEVEAAERLARSFADQGEWDIVELVAQRVVDSGKVRPPPGSKKKGISWPFSALGVVQMNKQEYPQAVTSFLSALRISPDDYYSYVGLGESYHNSGRYNSASRTFHYAEEPHDGMKMKISGDKWFTEYMLANVHRELGDHDDAIAGLKQVLESRPDEFGVLTALLQTYIERAWRCIETSFFGRAAESARLALELAAKIAELRPAAFNLWKGVGDACSLFYWTQEYASEFSVSSTKKLLAVNADEVAYDILQDVDGLGVKELSESDGTNGHSAADEHGHDFLKLAVLAYKRAVHCCANDLHAQAVAWYNLGWAEHRASHAGGQKERKKYAEAAVRCFKRAIELEAGNSEFWNALGVITTRLNPKVAQHAFVRSLHLNDRSVRTWTNLGALYLINADYELAHQAFGRAQSTDPDYGHAWLGEGLIALLTGDSQEALSHFTHAFEISNSSSLITKRQYGISVFDNLLSSQKTNDDITSLIQPLSALQQLHAQAPNDTSYSHLAAIFSERISDFTSSIAALTSICSTLESQYETTESVTLLGLFAHSKSDLARSLLAAHDYTSAADAASTALDLSSDTDPSASGLSPQSRTKIRLSSHLTSGLANFFLHDTDAAITSFRAALEESNSDPDVICLLAQVLWAKGGVEERGVAKDQLFSAVEAHSSHVNSVVLLGAIAALENDADVIDAVTDDLLSLRASDAITVEERSRIETVLEAITTLTTTDKDDEAGLNEVQAAICISPDQPHGWAELADRTGSQHAASMALLTAQRAVPPYGKMEADGLARAFSGTGTAGDAQRSIMLAPWKRDGWEAFAEALA